MTRKRSFARDERATGAAEFALVLPVFLLFLLGIIDVGRYAWTLNEMEKSVQVGARWAVVTDMVPSGLANYSFATGPATPVPQGDTVSTAYFNRVTCQKPATAVTCTCTGACAFGTAANATAFNNIVARMRAVYPPLDDTGGGVSVAYNNSGLGYSGDPNGPDVSPFVTVRIHSHGFPMFSLLGAAVPMPDLSHTLTQEDAVGTVANY